MATDLRLTRPWPKLVDFALNNAPEKLRDSHQRAHVPFPAILLRFLITQYPDYFTTELNVQKNMDFSMTYKEKSALRDAIRKEATDLGLTDPENYEEAANAVIRICQPCTIPDQVQEIFHDEKCRYLTQHSSKFWITARAVKEFVDAEGHGTLPLPGLVPDVKSDSERYIFMQNLYMHPLFQVDHYLYRYRDKAMADIEKVKAHAEILCRNLGIDFNSVISDEYITQFCRNAAHVRVVRFPSYAEAMKPGADLLKRALHVCIQSSSLGSITNDSVIYPAFLAAERFRVKHGWWPGRPTTEHTIPSVELVDSDCQAVHFILKQMIVEDGIAKSTEEVTVSNYCQCVIQDMYSCIF